MLKVVVIDLARHQVVFSLIIISDMNIYMTFFICCKIVDKCVYSNKG